MIIYRMIEDEENIEGRKVRTYGIEAVDGGNVLGSVRRISPAKEKVSRLIERCAALELSPIHLSDAVNDYIISDEY